eukprot:8240801-Alexandrium_andersonii.AAC.1
MAPSPIASTAPPGASAEASEPVRSGGRRAGSARFGEAVSAADRDEEAARSGNWHPSFRSVAGDSP